jgi:hypothetical protein
MEEPRIEAGGGAHAAYQGTRFQRLSSGTRTPAGSFEKPAGISCMDKNAVSLDPHAPRMVHRINRALHHGIQPCRSGGDYAHGLSQGELWLEAFCSDSPEAEERTGAHQVDAHLRGGRQVLRAQGDRLRSVQACQRDKRPRWTASVRGEYDNHAGGEEFVPGTGQELPAQVSRSHHRSRIGVIAYKAEDT